MFRSLRKGSSEGILLRFWRMSVTLLSLPIILLGYLQSETGREFGVSLSTKIRLIYKMARNNRRILTASHFIEHLIIATQVFVCLAQLRVAWWNAARLKAAAPPTYP